MLNLKKEPSIVKFAFPVRGDDSMMFSSKGAPIDKAVLLVNGRVLAVVRPPSSEDVEAPATTNEVPVETTLDFFGGIPLHNALLKDATTQVVLFARGESVPSLTIQVMQHCVTWDSIGGDIHRDIVTVTNEAGETRSKTLLYHISGAFGYERIAPVKESTSDAHLS